jgi:hypothetical protein
VLEDSGMLLAGHGTKSASKEMTSLPNLAYAGHS